jgi:hypothetical protein
MGAGPIRRGFLPLTPERAAEVTKRLFVMHPCYSVEAWLYQATDVLAECCAKSHQKTEHQRLIAGWAEDRTLLDEIERIKDGELSGCVGDQRNELLAAAFPADQVFLAQRSWTEFVEQLRLSEALRDSLGAAQN